MMLERLLVGMALGGVLFALLFWGLGLPDQQAYARVAGSIRYVLDDGGVDAGDCSDPQAPCRTVQYALAHAEDDDTIRVANKFSQAIYAGTVVVTRSVILEGGWAVVMHPHAGLLWDRPSPCEPFRTVLDGGQAGRVISITGEITPTIDCFTITGGDAAGLGGSPGVANKDAGGGIYSCDASPIIVNNVITGNHASKTTLMTVEPLGGGACSRGGGIYLLRAPATAVISDNLISHNVADGSGCGHGGGVALEESDAWVVSNAIEHNLGGGSAGAGGGIYVLQGGPVVSGNTMAFNAAGESDFGYGGGLYVFSAIPVIVEHNFIENNWALRGPGSTGLISRGGGIYYAGRSTIRAVIQDNVICDNIASLFSQTGMGGGVYLESAVESSIVEGNTLCGNVGGYNGSGYGGGICAVGCDVAIDKNRIIENEATHSGNTLGEGGGIHVTGGDVVVHNNVITGNFGVYFGWPCTGQGLGGGVSADAADILVHDNVIADNVATQAENEGQGGGLYVNGGTLVVEQNTIEGNVTSRDGFGGQGGGVYVVGSSNAELMVNAICGNTADRDGGGISLHESDGAVVRGNRICSNTARHRDGGGMYVGDSHGLELAQNTILWNRADQGGGLYLYGGGGDVRSLRLQNTIVGENEAAVGGGVYVKGVHADFLHTTLAVNQAGCGSGDGIYVTSGSADLANTILVGHDVGFYVSGDSTVTLEATLWGDGGWANGTKWDGPGTAVAEPPNLDMDPGFVDPVAGDFHIVAGSAAIGEGLPTGVIEDIDGEPRLAEPDLGADEYVVPGFLPLILRVGG